MEKHFTPLRERTQSSRTSMRTLILLSGMMLMFLMPSMSQAQCFSSWQYRAPITLNYQGNDTLADFQVKLSINTQALISAGQMRSDAGDLRFAGTDCCTPLCYYIESGINTTNTTVWVKVDQIMAPNSGIVMLYGDSSAIDASDPDCTFEFWDDFNDNQFDQSKWEVRGNPTIVESGGNVAITGSGNWDYIRSTANWSSPVSVNYSYQAQSVSTGFVLGYTGSDQRYSFRANNTTVGVCYDPDVISSNSWYNQSYPGVPFPQGANFNEYTVIPTINSNAIEVLSFCNNTTSNCNTTATNLNQYTGSSFYVGFTSWNSGHTGTIDYIWVTKYSPNAISATVGTPVNVAPRALAGVDSVSFCSGQGLTLDAGNGFLSYMWQNGDTSQTFNVNMPGLYTVATVDSLGCTVVDSVTASNLPSPSPVIAPGDTSTCSGTPVTFSTAQTYVSYSWSNGDTTQSTTSSTGGTITVEVTDANGCTGMDTVVYTVLAAPSPSITGDTSACEGSIIVLDAGAGFVSYDWSTNDQTQTTDVSASGTYSVVVTDSNGCTGSDNISVNFLSNPVPSVTTAGDTLFASSGVSYQWMMNGNAINGATDSLYIPTSTGAYSVMVTYANGCSNTSDTTSVIIGLEDALNRTVSIFPNPTQGQVKVGLEVLQAGDLEIRLFDLSGKLLVNETVAVSKGTLTRSLNLSDLAEGMYLLELELNGQKMSKRLIKN